MKKLLAHDKLKHFFVGFFIFLILSFFFNDIVSFYCVFAIASTKEIRDKITGKGTPELLDIIYTITPGILIILKSINQ